MFLRSDLRFVLFSAAAFWRSLWKWEREIVKSRISHEVTSIEVSTVGAHLAQETLFLCRSRKHGKQRRWSSEERGWLWLWGSRLAPAVSVSLEWVSQFQAGGKEWVESAWEIEIDAAGWCTWNLQLSNSLAFNNLLGTLPDSVSTCDCIFKAQVWQCPSSCHLLATARDWWSVCDPRKSCLGLIFQLPDSQAK